MTAYEEGCAQTLVFHMTRKNESRGWQEGNSWWENIMAICCLLHDSLGHKNALPFLCPGLTPFTKLQFFRINWRLSKNVDSWAPPSRSVRSRYYSAAANFTTNCPIVTMTEQDKHLFFMPWPSPDQWGGRSLSHSVIPGPLPGGFNSLWPHSPLLGLLCSFPR